MALLDETFRRVCVRLCCDVTTHNQRATCTREHRKVDRCETPIGGQLWLEHGNVLTCELHVLALPSRWRERVVDRSGDDQDSDDDPELPAHLQE